jgi:hypothetical protein
VVRQPTDFSFVSDLFGGIEITIAAVGKPDCYGVDFAAYAELLFPFTDYETDHGHG